MLYIVSTPIGNLKDITLRALDTLKACSHVLCEDTRRTGKLLSCYEIKAKLVSFNDFNKEKKTPEIILALKQGTEIAIVSDAGTPGISDPGFYLVRACTKENIPVSPVPGACSMLAALVCSGLPTDAFTFYGFLPKKSKKKEDILERLKEKKETSIFFESPHRIKKTINALAMVLPNRNIVVARELTKKFEEFLRGKPDDLLERINDREIKGEIVICIEGK